MNHIFSIHSSVVGHLGHFQLLAITDKAAMNIVELVSLCHGGASLGVFPRVVLLGLQVDLFPIFWGTSRLISRVVVPVCNYTNNERVFLFFHILTNICCHLNFFILAILTGVRCNLRVVLICISLIIKDVEHFFRCFSAIRHSSGENSLFSSEPHFLMGLFDFSGIYLLEFFIYIGY